MFSNSNSNTKSSAMIQCTSKSKCFESRIASRMRIFILAILLGSSSLGSRPLNSTLNLKYSPHLLFFLDFNSPLKLSSSFLWMASLPSCSSIDDHSTRKSRKIHKSFHQELEPYISESLSRALPVPRDTFREDLFAEGSLGNSTFISLKASLIGLLCFKPPSWNFPKPVILLGVKILWKLAIIPKVRMAFFTLVLRM